MQISLESHFSMYGINQYNRSFFVSLNLHVYVDEKSTDSMIQACLRSIKGQEMSFLLGKIKLENHRIRYRVAVTSTILLLTEVLAQ